MWFVFFLVNKKKKTKITELYFEKGFGYTSTSNMFIKDLIKRYKRQVKV